MTTARTARNRPIALSPFRCGRVPGTRIPQHVRRTIDKDSGFEASHVRLRPAAAGKQCEDGKGRPQRGGHRAPEHVRRPGRPAPRIGRRGGACRRRPPSGSAAAGPGRRPRPCCGGVRPARGACVRRSCASCGCCPCRSSCLQRSSVVRGCGSVHGGIPASPDVRRPWCEGKTPALPRPTGPSARVAA